jgi:uncharacterized protein (DUF3084 family)
MDEIEQLKKDILKLEFQHKKDLAENQKQLAESEKRFNERAAKIQAQLNHITKLAGIAFENFEEIDSTFTKVSKPTARKK